MDKRSLGAGYSFRTFYLNAKPKRKGFCTQDATQEARVIIKIQVKLFYYTEFGKNILLKVLKFLLFERIYKKKNPLLFPNDRQEQENISMLWWSGLWKEPLSPTWDLKSQKYNFQCCGICSRNQGRKHFFLERNLRSTQ